MIKVRFKLLSIILGSIFFLVTIVPVIVHSANAVTADGPSATVTATAVPVLAAGDVSDVPGSVIQMPLNLTSSGEVVALQCDLSYDHALLTYQQISAGSLTSSFTVNANPVGDKLRIIIYNSTNTPIAGGSGSVAQVQFKVADGAAAGQASTLGLSGVILANQDGQSIQATASDGQFTVLQVADTTAPAWTNGSLTYSGVSQSGLTLNWSGATDNVAVAGYKVYQGSALLTASPVTGTSYNVTGLSAGTEYTFTAQAVDAAGNESTDGPNVTVTTESEPVADTTAPAWTNGSLTYSGVSQSGLTLNWSGATDNVAVTGYKVYQGSALLTASPVTGTSYNVTGLSAGSEYTFTVQAVDAAGNESTDGPSVTVTATAVPVLAAGDVSDVPGSVIQMPLNLTSSGEVVALQCDLSYDHALLTYQQISAGSLTSSFTVNANPVGDKLRIIIYNSTNTPIAGGSGSVAQVQFKVADGAAAGQTSTLGLSGVILSNQDGQSIQATASDGQFTVLQVADTTAPAWTNGSLTYSGVSQSGLTLNWSGATDNVAVAGYKVYQGSALLTASPVTGTSYNVTGLSAGTEYTFTAQAVDAAGNESTDGPSVIVTTASSGGAVVTLELSKYTAQPGDSVTASGTAEVSDWVPIKVIDSTQSIIVFNAIKSDANGNYSYTFILPDTSEGILTVVAGSGSNVANKALTVTQLGDTTAPAWTNGSLTYSGVSQSGLTLNWSGATDNVAVTGYKVYQGSVLLTAAPVTGTSYDVTGLSADTEYTFTVQAVDAAGNESTDGPSVTVTTESEPGGDTTAPAWTNGSLTYSGVSQSGLTLNWSGATDNVAVTGYKVYQGSVLLTADPVAGTSYDVTGLSAGTEYTFTVQAVDAAGNESTDGPNVTVKTSKGVPITDSNVTISDDGANKDLAVTADTPDNVTITVPTGVTDATVSVSALLNAPAAGEVTTTSLPALTIDANTSISGNPIQVSIPAGTAVSAPIGWDGTIHVPTVQSNDSVTVTPDSGNTATVNSVIEIGYGDVPLTFSKAVRILIPGQAGKDVGYTRGGAFTKITNIMDSDSQEAGDALASGGDGKIDVGNDLVVWTKHFTKFVTYTQESDTTAPVWTDGSLTTSDISKNGLTLNWSGASDNVAVTGYRVYQGIVLLTAAPVTGTSYDVTGLSAGTKYTFTIQAVDAAGNESTDGPGVTATTKKSSGSGGGGGSSSPSAVNSTTGTAMVTPGAGGTISLGDETAVAIPADALRGTSAVEVKIQEVGQSPTVPSGFKLAGSVYEFTVGGQGSYSFAKNVTIKLSFDPKLISAGETPVIQYYDEEQEKWVNSGGTVSGNIVTAQVDHFTKFAVMAAEKKEQPQAGILKDVAGHWALSSINELVSLGAIAGYPDGSFKPDNTITRAEFATVLAKAFKLAPRSGKIFTDTADHWAGDYIATVAASGIVSGYNDSTFGPDELITREQMAVMIVKAARLSPVEEEPVFNDSDRIADWAKEAVAVATRNGIMSGYPDSTVRPMGNATRAEAATVIVKALGLKSE